MRLVIVGLVLAIATRASATPKPTKEHPLVVVDAYISDSEQKAIEKELVALRTHGVEMAVVVTRSLDGDSIEIYAFRVATWWSSGSQRAAVLVFGLDDRKSRLEVSDSLRVKLSDSRAQLMLDDARKHLRDDLYAKAVLSVVADVTLLAQLPDPPPRPARATPSATANPAPAPPEPSTGGVSIIVWVLVGIVVLPPVVIWLGHVWAKAVRRRRVRIKSNLWKETKPFKQDWVECSVKVLVIVLLLPIALLVWLVMKLPRSGGGGSAWTSDSGSWNTSDNDSSYSSGGDSGYSGGGDSGYSGGGASSDW